MPETCYLSTIAIPYEISLGFHFIIDLAAECSLPKIFLIPQNQNVSKSVSEEELSSSSFKKALKRKR